MFTDRQLFEIGMNIDTRKSDEIENDFMRRCEYLVSGYWNAIEVAGIPRAAAVIVTEHAQRMNIQLHERRIPYTYTED